MKVLENRIPPPVLALLAGVAMAASAWSFSDPALPLTWRLAVASPLFIAAGFYGFPAIARFRRVGTSIDPVRIDQASTLVTSGIYSFTRNPMYVALTMLLFTLAIGLGHWSLLLGPIAFVVFTNRFQIIPEERVLRRRFGADYEKYTSAVRRWL